MQSSHFNTTLFNQNAHPLRAPFVWSFTLNKLVLALGLSCLSMSAAHAQQASEPTEAPKPKEDAVRLGAISISGKGDRLGVGLLLNEDAVKARSTVTKESTEKDRATGTPYQALALLPGINTYSHDATGLFGGGLTIRGFNSDQIGFTINGTPVNDSGNFAVFPQEYVDQENSCTQSVAQGVAEVESPHVGATGGSVSIVTCSPEENRRLRFAQTVGGLHLTRSYARYDTGRFANDMAKSFISVSHTEAEKWRGQGKARRDHVDTAFNFDPSATMHILGSILYNRAINNNFLAPSLAQLQANGYFYDTSTVFAPGHLPAVNGTVQRETGPTPVYYRLGLNPFENVVASLSGSFQLSENLQLKVQPYYWYGYGTGGSQQRALSEKGFLNTTTGVIGAGRDLNGDRDTLDTIIVANSSVTRTQRPGFTTELSYLWGAHLLKAGFGLSARSTAKPGPQCLWMPAARWPPSGSIAT